MENNHKFQISDVGFLWLPSLRITGILLKNQKSVPILEFFCYLEDGTMNN